MTKYWVFHCGKSSLFPLEGYSKDHCMQQGTNHGEQETSNVSSTAVVSKSSTTTKDMLNGSQTLYYAVSLPSDACGSGKDAMSLVFTDKREALKVVKQHSGSRFKVFRTKKDAVSFALQNTEEVATPTGHLITEVVPQKCYSENLYKQPNPHEIAKFRKVIEGGDISAYLGMVWRNPRFLVAAGDTPTVLYAGHRYNALHIAARSNQREMCSLIIKTIESRNFMEWLYIGESDEIHEQRISYLIDLYLNMPEKKLNETPLHFASKFGSLECVQVLVSHPACDKKVKNVYGQEAKDIICTRCPSATEELKVGIAKAFEDWYFVPVLRTEDNSLQPFISKPCRQTLELGSLMNESPAKSKFSVTAFAGPLSSSEADMFYRYWKTPPSQFSRIRYQQLNRIRLTDPEKGLERLGRYLARNLNAPWTEYWPILDEWCDLSSEEGLNLLEDHLSSVYRSKYVPAERPEGAGAEDFLRSNLCHSLLSPARCIVASLVTMFGRVDEELKTGQDFLSWLTDLVIPEVEYLLRSSSSGENLSVVHSVIGIALFKWLRRIVILDFDGVLRELKNCIAGLEYKNDMNVGLETDPSQSHFDHRIELLKWDHLGCILHFVSNFHQGNELKQNTCECSWPADCKLEHCSCGESAFMNEQYIESQDVLSDSESEYVTPCSSPSSSMMSDDGDDSTDSSLATTIDDEEIYVSGFSEPSKADVDMFRAIEHAHVDPARYPLTSFWKHTMSLIDKETMERWPSPRREKLTPPRPLYSPLQATPTKTRISNCKLKEAKDLFNEFLECEDKSI